MDKTIVANLLQKRDRYKPFKFFNKINSFLFPFVKIQTCTFCNFETDQQLAFAMILVSIHKFNV